MRRRDGARGTGQGGGRRSQRTCACRAVLRRRLIARQASFFTNGLASRPDPRTTRTQPMVTFKCLSTCGGIEACRASAAEIQLRGLLLEVFTAPYVCQELCSGVEKCLRAFLRGGSKGWEDLTAVSHLRAGPRSVHLELALLQDGSVRNRLEVHLDCGVAANKRGPKDLSWQCGSRAITSSLPYVTPSLTLAEVSHQLLRALHLYNATTKDTPSSFSTHVPNTYPWHIFPGSSLYHLCAGTTIS